MSALTFGETWGQFVAIYDDQYEDKTEMVNDFCNIYANSYEEYMRMFNALISTIKKEGV
jgi:hypothetical protein